jgi:hypothetical protein
VDLAFGGETPAFENHALWCVKAKAMFCAMGERLSAELSNTLRRTAELADKGGES